ncbi:MAG: hypothetical protein ACREAM_18465, partial [Blastocatellia bacterium]
MKNSVRRRVTVGFVLLVIFLMNERMQASPLWGELKPGGYAVGFRTLFVRDLARPALAGRADKGEGAAQGHGRQMQIGIWYPARRAQRQARMWLGEYVRLMARELDFS